MNLFEIFQQLGPGITETAKIFFWTLLCSVPLGVLVMFGRMSGNLLLCSFVQLYISIMRGTPLMLQLMVVYFGPYFIFGIQVTSGYRIYAVLIAFILNYAAYFAEIYRSGMISIPKGQYEAAKLLGYPKHTMYIRIILPQVVKRILPSMTNEIITLVKDTSLAFSIAYAEMFTMAKAFASTQKSVLPFVAAGIFYYVANLVIALVMERIEKKLSYYE